MTAPGEDRPPDDHNGNGNGRGTVGLTGPGPLCVFGAIGLVAGWGLRALAIRMGRAEPEVTWLSIGIVFFIAAVIGGAAYHTWRTRRDGIRLEPHRAVNRLVLGKTCALVGAGIAGGYFGFALAHLGVTDSSGANAQLWHSVVAGCGGILVMVASLLLEQACRVRDHEK
ncbi:DUF3180 domain-containing protein [Nocardioides terrisoli]|uniref:DUF3180 domain-containing protein n=1 Tax=Nocardioides terrisoli TaxID=3388267 RepID=UPI00287B8C85|nr:DUF3180 domain-containing protein [Nocardioides marmorisolisilvae]